MKTYTAYHVDAFTHRPLAGNPCAVVMGADSLTDAQMQTIARELNLSETAFVVRSAVADVGARYFTPAEEIPLAGHPTIATTIALLDSGKLTLTNDSLRFTLELKAGVIPIDVNMDDTRRPMVTMTQLKPKFLRIYEPGDIAPVFGLTAEDVLPGVPVQTVDTGTPMLMIPLVSSEALRRAEPKADAFRSAREAGDFFGPHLFVLEGATDHGDTFARNFSIPPDAVEDPFTGSATGCMGAYLWRYGLIQAPSFTAEQGHWMGRPGSARVEILGPPEEIECVRVSGSGVTVMEGSIYV